jgi:hypothetical protein
MRTLVRAAVGFLRGTSLVWRNVAWAAGIITLSVLLLSAAGMHALMSFTVAQRHARSASVQHSAPCHASC